MSLPCGRSPCDAGGVVIGCWGQFVTQSIINADDKCGYNPQEPEGEDYAHSAGHGSRALVYRALTVNSSSFADIITLLRLRQAQRDPASSARQPSTSNQRLPMLGSGRDWRFDELPTPSQWHFSGICRRLVLFH